jgi:succinate-semialdehyde dehydrogenase/glutarate-semialdehyde dehydrogenase
MRRITRGRSRSRWASRSALLADEVRKCASVCSYYAARGEELLRPVDVETDAGRSYVRFDPLGPVLAIMPWNFPFWQVFRFAAPALMAGNVCLLKHAANVPQCALAIEQIFSEAGFAEGAFQSLLIGTAQAAAVIEDARVKAVTLTGSERAGADVASRAARQIKKSVLELGGSDPFIVMPSADLENASAVGVKSRTINAGQSCIAAKRFIIAEAITAGTSSSSWPRCARSRSAIRWTRIPTSGRSPPSRSAAACTSRCRRRSTLARSCC